MKINKKLQFYIKTAKAEVHEYKDSYYLSVPDFAKLAGKKRNYIYELIKKGNIIRKLRFKKIFGKTLIPLEELNEFIFTSSHNVPYTITEEGKRKYVVDGFTGRYID